MDALEDGSEGCMVSVRDWLDLDALGAESGVWVAREDDNFMLARVKDCGKDCGTETTGSSGHCDFDHC